MILNEEGNLIFSVSPDGTVRVWNNSCNDGLFYMDGYCVEKCLKG
jgi:WD40 repeat protein